MTIEERFEKLTERHEAITQTIELMAHENRERDAAWDKRQADWEIRFGHLMEGLELLLT